MACGPVGEKKDSKNLAGPQGSPSQPGGDSIDNGIKPGSSKNPNADKAKPDVSKNERPPLKPGENTPPPPPVIPQRGIPKTAEERDKVCLEVVDDYKNLPSKKVTILTKSDDLEQRFLATHNQVRSRYGLSSLKWDSQIAAYAQAWANHLRDTNNCEMQHRSHQGRKDGKEYGENLAYNWISQALGSGEYNGSPEFATLAWSEECKDFNYEKNDCKAGEQCGHFTQVVWQTAEKVGCGVAVCRSGGAQSEIWVCNYDPAGNMTLITNGVSNKLKPF